VARFRRRVAGLDSPLVEVPVEALHILCQWIVTTWSTTSDVDIYDDFTPYWADADSNSHCRRRGDEGAAAAERAAIRYAAMRAMRPPPQPAVHAHHVMPAPPDHPETPTPPEIPLPVVPQPTTPELHPHPTQPAHADPQEASQQSGAAGGPASLLAAALGVLAVITTLF